MPRSIPGTSGQSADDPGVHPHLLVTKTRRKPSPAQTAKTRPRPQRAPWLWLAGILALTFVVYIPTLDNALTNWDDMAYVTKNPLVTNPNFHAILTTDLLGNYHPITIWSLVLNYKMSGANPAGYHWLNLILHLVNTALVFLFLHRFTGGRLWTTVAGSLLFGIHPMHVESVAWIAERKDVLYALFYLVGLIVYLRYLDRRHWAWLIATLAAYVLALASKPAAVVFPLTLLLLDWYRRRKFTMGVLLEKVPFFILSVVMGLLTLTAQKATGAIGTNWGPFDKLVFASFGTLMYIVKLFLPFGLSAIYPYPNVEGRGIGAEFYAAFAVVVLLIPLAVIACRRSRIVAFGLGFFLINVFLVLQFATVGQAVMADRYTYLPYIGLVLALAWWLDDAPGARKGPSWVRPAIAGCLLLLVPVSLVQTWRRGDVWQDSGTLWNDTIEKYPRRIYGAYASRGAHYREVTKQLDKARADFDQAISMNPKVATAWNDKGMLFVDLGQYDSALVYFDQAVRLEPRLGPARSNRGAILLGRGNPAAAVEDFTVAIEASPRLLDARTNRSLAYSALGDHEKAIADLRTALALEPNHPLNHAYWNAIGLELSAMNRHREAIGEFDRAIQLAPAGPNPRSQYLLNRSRAWLALGDRARAAADAEEARRLGAAIDPAYLHSIGG